MTQLNETNRNGIQVKKESNLLKSFKTYANPLYQPNFGIALNHIAMWDKFPEHNYIIVTTSGGVKRLFVGTTAHNILLSIGDKDCSKFQHLTPEEEVEYTRKLLASPDDTTRETTEE